MQALLPTYQLVRVKPGRVARGLFLAGLLAGFALGCSCSERAPAAAVKATTEPKGTPPALPAAAVKATAELKGTPPALPAAPELLRARQQFRAEQDGRMRGELSPLTRVGYVHLPEGEHLVGSGDRATVRLDPAASGAGEVRLRVDAEGRARRLTLQAQPAIARNGVPVTAAVLASGDVLTLGRLRLLVTGLPEDPAVALYDPAAPARQGYRELLYFPDDERFVTRGRLERYPTPRAVRLDASRGEPRPLLALGTLHFSLGGAALTLEAYSDSPATATAPAQLFLIFKDKTSGQPDGSYGAGRFLTPRLLAGDEVVLDFNQAWNPLCAYSHYFHCPLPPRGNWLPLAIPAGERSYPAP